LLSVPKAKAKKPADRTITFKLCSRGHITDDILGVTIVNLDGQASPFKNKKHARKGVTFHVTHTKKRKQGC